VNASKTNNEDIGNFEVDVNEGIAAEIRDDLREIEANKANEDTEDGEAEINVETSGQSPLEKARANYWRWRGIATDAMRQYRYAAAGLSRELRSAQEQNRRKAAAESSERSRHRRDTASGESSPASEV